MKLDDDNNNGDANFKFHRGYANLTSIFHVKRK